MTGRKILHVRDYLSEEPYKHIIKYASRFPKLKQDSVLIYQQTISVKEDQAINLNKYIIYLLDLKLIEKKMIHSIKYLEKNYVTTYKNKPCMIYKKISKMNQIFRCQMLTVACRRSEK